MTLRGARKAPAKPQRRRAAGRRLEQAAIQEELVRNRLYGPLPHTIRTVERLGIAQQSRLWGDGTGR
jgi:hypothetical protein